jgi:hypothetical protein
MHIGCDGRAQAARPVLFLDRRAALWVDLVLQQACVYSVEVVLFEPD